MGTCKILKDRQIAELTAENATLRKENIELHTELRLSQEPNRQRVNDHTPINDFGRESDEREVLGGQRRACRC